MSMPHRFVAFALPFLLPLLVAQDPPVQAEPGQSAAPAPRVRLTEERVRQAYADSLAACAKAFGKALDPELPLAFVSREQMAETIERENLPIVRLRIPDAAQAEAAAKQLAAALAQGAYAKYSWADARFLVALETWREQVRLLDLPALAEDAALRAVMVHELCHAYDDRRFGFAARLIEADTEEAVKAVNAVIEGSAQLQARRICGQNGWLDGFAVMREAVGKLPKSVLRQGEAMALLVRSMVASATFAYYDGEDFVTAVVAAEPEGGHERVFRTPPREQELILNPAWYLDPAQRPAVLYDPAPALDRFQAAFDSETWNATRAQATAQQMAAGMTLLPAEDVANFQKSVRNAQLLQLTPKANPQSRMVVCVVIEFDGEASAAQWLDYAERLSKRKDETMATGRVRIVGSERRELVGADHRGWLFRKRMKAGTKEFDVANIDLQRGRIVVETVMSAEPLPDEEHERLVVETLAAVRLRAATDESAKAGPATDTGR